MRVETIDILTLIPQRPPFVMVDRLLSFTESGAVSGFTVQEDNLFCRDGVLLETGIMENIAQTCAARIGYINLLNRDSVKIGVIGSIKNFQLSELPAVGDRLETTVLVLSEVMAITLVSAVVRCKGREIARCEMKISLTDKEIG